MTRRPNKKPANAEADMVDAISALFAVFLKTGVEELYRLGIPPDVREAWIVQTTMNVGRRLGVPAEATEKLLEVDDEKSRMVRG